MPDSIINIPFKITSVDTSEHELIIEPSLIGSSPYQLIIEVTTGTIKLSVGKPSSGQSATYSQASNNKTIITMQGRMSLYYTATTIGDAFVGSI